MRPRVPDAAEVAPASPAKTARTNSPARTTPVSPVGEEGSALLLTIFYGFLSLVLIFLVVAATSLYL